MGIRNRLTIQCSDWIFNTIFYSIHREKQFHAFHRLRVIFQFAVPCLDRRNYKRNVASSGREREREQHNKGTWTNNLEQSAFRYEGEEHSAMRQFAESMRNLTPIRKPRTREILTLKLSYRFFDANFETFRYNETRERERERNLKGLKLRRSDKIKFRIFFSSFFACRAKHQRKTRSSIQRRCVGESCRNGTVN